MPTTEIIHPDGRRLLRRWESNTRPAYEWLSRAVAAPGRETGYIEDVGFHHPDAGRGGSVTVYANEEGRLNNLDANVPGMQAIHWRAPKEGWDAYDGNMGNQPSVMFASTPEEMAALQRELAATWSPVVGPVLIMRGFAPDPNEAGDDDPSDRINPDDLGTLVASGTTEATP